MTASYRVPLFLDAPSAICWKSVQPVTVGIPFPRGILTDLTSVRLHDPSGQSVAVQGTSLAHWSDGSVKWLLLDFLTTPESVGQGGVWEVVSGCDSLGGGRTDLVVTESPNAIAMETGSATFQVARPPASPGILSVCRKGNDETVAGWIGLDLANPQNGYFTQHVETIAIEARGPVCARVRVEGQFRRRRQSCRFRARFSVFAGTGLIRAVITLHNPRRARHSGGLWDLGDPGSLCFGEFVLRAKLCTQGPEHVSWSDSVETPLRPSLDSRVRIYQESSGGENWASRNHLNREGHVPLSSRGYRVHCGDVESDGLRANPIVTIERSKDRLAVAVPNFWQKFPKSIESAGQGTIEVGLFPRDLPGPHELQGGEQTTHTVWFDFGEAGSDADLRWVYHPIVARAESEWYATSGAIPGLAPSSADPGNPLDALVNEAGGPEGLIARREIIDEFGWRNFGDVYADHEAEHYDGPHKPPVSHYNNQYDQILGFAYQFLRTGNPLWAELYVPLARHVIDIDIYHTQEDKAAYNGGLFWFTDHYKDAGTSTHRTYSKANCESGDRSYGGGPSAAHNFSTGLLLTHYLTGDPDAQAAVLELADWVLAMDDGRKTPLGLIDRGPTGLASFTFDPNYHGPGRGCGNSIAVLLDGWLASGDGKYLEKAEELIQRSIHPSDDIERRDLLNVELRWSYTVFLSALGDYLDLKAEASEFDTSYAYARESLLRYALWMLDHEVPYFDRRDQLEYPTEAWAGQELRKGNVMRQAARHAESPVREALARRGDELIARAWSDLNSFESRTSARALALALNEGTRAVAMYAKPGQPAPKIAVDYDFGRASGFVSQKQRVLAPLRAARRLIRP
jgi:YetA-like protein